MYEVKSPREQKVTDPAIEQHKKFLINIVMQDIMFDFEMHTIVFIKDITFGVLYEQICAKDKLNHMIYDICQKRMDSLTLLNLVCMKVYFDQYLIERLLVELHGLTYILNTPYLKVLD